MGYFLFQYLPLGGSGFSIQEAPLLKFVHYRPDIDEILVTILLMEPCMRFRTDFNIGYPS